MDKKATMPLRIGLNVLYTTPAPEFSVGNLMQIPIGSSASCVRCDKRKHVAAVTPAPSGSDTDDDLFDPHVVNPTATSDNETGDADPDGSLVVGDIEQRFDAHVELENPLL